MRVLPFCKIISLIALSFLTSCASGPSSGGGYQRPYIPQVSLPDPSRLSENERRYLPEVAQALQQAGYQPTSGNAEYRVDLHLEDGPINADSSLLMFRNGSEIARANARVGGATMILRRQQFVNESFHQCLQDFAVKIPHVGGGQGGYRPPTGGPENPDQPYQAQPDWQRGW